MKRTSQFVFLALMCLVFSLIFGAEGTSGTDLISRYRHESSELAKRDLTLKMIDTGVLKLAATTEKDVARIFGADWLPDVKIEQSRACGIIHFAKQHTGGMKDGEEFQSPWLGWYMVIWYNTKNKLVYDWHLSNSSK